MQTFILKHEIVVGVSSLLHVRANLDIIRNTVKAVSYLSMNYEFVNQPISLEILKRLMPLLDTFYEDTTDNKNMINLIFSISNILKGDS